MKKTIAALGALLLMSSLAVQAQKSSVYVKAGLNLANISVNKDGQVDDSRTLASFHAGLQADLPVGPFFAIQPGVFFTGKGSKLESGNTSGDNWYRVSTRPYYIEVPVNAVIKIPLDEEVRFFVGAGPYAAIGVGGKNKIEGELLGADFSRTQNIKFSDDDPFTSGEEGSGYGIMRRFDYGLNGTAGVEGKRAVFSVNYGLGLAKLQSGTGSSDDELNKHRVLSFTVGVKL
ncbi:porin family protein [Agriterribacter sp.]|uniref:porin family protein n=1 Tax=Agriterribacter sp. TaxID=2821509 RepID=UPI002CF9C53A|nr:porin family protein [Agriterribacter sp.]HRP57797.1 porin family protein [Agriterribacter sp.]